MKKEWTTQDYKKHIVIQVGILAIFNLGYLLAAIAQKNLLALLFYSVLLACLMVVQFYKKKSAAMTLAGVCLVQLLLALFLYYFTEPPPLQSEIFKALASFAISISLANLVSKYRLAAGQASQAQA